MKFCLKITFKEKISIFFSGTKAIKKEQISDLQAYGGNFSNSASYAYIYIKMFPVNSFQLVFDKC